MAIKAKVSKHDRFAGKDVAFGIKTFEGAQAYVEKHAQPKTPILAEGLTRCRHSVEMDCIYVDGILLDPLQAEDFKKSVKRIAEFGASDVDGVAVREWRGAHVIREGKWGKP
uniref:Uncharacterized protein n=1 Tax=viral metagenome TaxID=1070528 RepID=A0A6M3XQP1_9ZZZZ